MIRKHKTVAALIAAGLLLYLGNYVVVSSYGRYVPDVWGFGWMKSYKWAPFGFVSDRAGIDRPSLPQLLYFPLWFVDVQLIHRLDRERKGVPINNVRKP